MRAALSPLGAAQAAATMYRALSGDGSTPARSAATSEPAPDSGSVANGPLLSQSDSFETAREASDVETDAALRVVRGEDSSRTSGGMAGDEDALPAAARSIEPSSSSGAAASGRGPHHAMASRGTSTPSAPYDSPPPTEPVPLGAAAPPASMSTSAAADRAANRAADRAAYRSGEAASAPAETDETKPLDDGEDEMVLKQIDHYELLEVVGEGMQGVVYKCRDINTGEFRALKELRNMAGKVQNMRTEIAVMKRLKHPNLTRLFEVYDAPLMNTSLFLVMDFVDGGPVMRDSDLLAGRAEPLPVADAQVVFKQLVRGLSYLHAHGVLHRDVKPSNVLRDSVTGVVKLSDFGVSSFTSHHKSARVLGEDDVIFVGTCGTPAFMSPEGLGAGHDRVYHGRPADVWAAGATLFCFVYGQLPFYDRANGHMDETLRRIIEEPLKFPAGVRGVPASAKELLSKMLEKDNAKRHTLSMVASHPWVDVNWKSDSVDEFVAPTTADVRESLSLPGIINQVRKSSSGLVMRGIIAVNERLASSRGSKTPHHASSQAQAQAQQAQARDGSTSTPEAGAPGENASPKPAPRSISVSSRRTRAGSADDALSVSSAAAFVEQQAQPPPNSTAPPAAASGPFAGLANPLSFFRGSSGSGAAAPHKPHVQFDEDAEVTDELDRFFRELLCCGERGGAPSCAPPAPPPA